MKCELLYKSDTFISFILADEKYDIPQADPRFENICAELENPEKLYQAVHLFQDIPLPLDQIYSILEKQDLNSKVFKNIYFNLKNHFKMNEDDIVSFLNDRLIPLDDAGFFFLTVGLKKYEAAINIDESLFRYIISICSNKSLLSYLGISQSKLQYKIANIISKSSNPKQKIIFLLLNLIENKDTLEKHLSCETLFITNMELKDADQEISQVKKMLLYCYENKIERMINHLKSNKIDIVSGNLHNKFNSLYRYKRISQKKYSSFQEIAETINKNYKLLLDSIEYFKLQEKHEILKNEERRFVGEYEMIFPKSNAEVIEWGKKFANCYSTRIAEYNLGKRLLFGLIKNGEIEFVGEYLYQSSQIGDFEGYVVKNVRRYPDKCLKSDVLDYLKKEATV